MNLISRIFKWLTKDFGDLIEKQSIKNYTPIFLFTRFKDNLINIENIEYSLEHDALLKLLNLSSTRGYIEETSGIAHRDWNKIANYIASDMPWKVITATNAYKDIPIALYFDFSLSNYRLCYSLAKIALNLLKKDTMLYIGENGNVERIIIVKNPKLLPQELSNKEAFDNITEGEINGVKVFQSDERELSFLSKKYHNRKIWIFSDFDVAISSAKATQSTLEKISSSIKITWFCTELMNYGKKRKALHDDIIENLRYNSEIIFLKSFDDLVEYADGNGNEMDKYARERGIM